MMITKQVAFRGQNAGPELLVLKGSGIGNRKQEEGVTAQVTRRYQAIRKLSKHSVAFSFLRFGFIKFHSFLSSFPFFSWCSEMRLWNLVPFPNVFFSFCLHSAGISISLRSSGVLSLYFFITRQVDMKGYGGLKEDHYPHVAFQQIKRSNIPKKKEKEKKGTKPYI